MQKRNQQSTPYIFALNRNKKREGGGRRNELIYDYND